MRVPRWRLATFVVALLLTAWTWSATLSDHSTWLRYRPLYSRGITTTATVLSYHYDPEGGDPGGWTTDRITFMTRQGESITATVGHHDPGTERTTHAIGVTYDPVHPDVVIAADANVAPTDGSEWYVGLVLAFPSAFGAAALGRWAWRARYRRGRMAAGSSE